MEYNLTFKNLKEREPRVGSFPFTRQYLKNIADVDIIYIKIPFLSIFLPFVGNLLILFPKTVIIKR